MTYIDGCQIPGYQRINEGDAEGGPRSPIKLLKRALARPWNYLVKPKLKQMAKMVFAWKKGLNMVGKTNIADTPLTSVTHLKADDLVRVRDRDEIEASLDPFKELKGCAFLEYMWQYCGTTQDVLKPVEQFLDERDYKVKKAKGVVLLKGVLCNGTPVFGQCDRACHLFWREEWLEKIPQQDNPDEVS